MDRELLDLIADYVEARAAKRDAPGLFDPELSPDPDKIADEVAKRAQTFVR